MPAPSEPEKFSIDEIIDRLKNPPDEEPISEGELVTRADGSQAIRVRKRKRRSQQPQKDELRQLRRSRMIQISGVLLLILMAAFAVGSAIVYANSAPFRKNVIRMIGTSSGARVELERFRVNPTRANAGQIILTWPEGNALRELSVRGIGAAIAPSSFFGKSLIGEEVTSTDGILSLAVPQAGEPARATPASVGEPQPIRFNRYAISKLQVRLGDPAQPLVHMRDSEGSFQPVNANDRPQLLLNRGDITIRGWPRIRLDRSHIEFRGGDVDIVGMRLLHESDNRGIFELAGTVSPYASARPSNLTVRLESFLLSGVLGPEMGRLFSGRVDTLLTPKSNSFSFTPGSAPSPTLALSFRNSPVSPIEIQGFPFLSSLARMLEDNWFERPVVETDATGTLLRTDSSVVIGDLQLEHKGRMAIRGGVTMTPDRRLSGSFEVGIAEAMVHAAENRRLDAITGLPKDGFRWFTLKIAGSATAPTDNFLDLLDASKLPAKPATAPGVPTFEELTAPE
jgi:hypothetical protein